MRCHITAKCCLDNSAKKRTQKVQNCCVRFIYDLRKFHISYKYVGLGWLMMDNRIKLHLSHFVMKIINDPSSHLSLIDKLVFRFDISLPNSSLKFAANNFKSKLSLFYFIYS